MMHTHYNRWTKFSKQRQSIHRTQTVKDKNCIRSFWDVVDSPNKFSKSLPRVCIQKFIFVQEEALDWEINIWISFQTLEFTILHQMKIEGYFHCG